MNVLGRTIIPFIATPGRVAAVRRRLARRPRLLALLRRGTLWLSTVGDGRRREVLRACAAGGEAARQPVLRDHFSAVLAINVAEEARDPDASPLERLMRDVLAGLPGLDFPPGAQAAFALLKYGGSIPQAIETARSRQIADREINVALHAFLLRRFPTAADERHMRERESIAFVTELLNRRDPVIRQGGRPRLRREA